MSPGENGGQIRAEDSDTDQLNRVVEHEVVEAYPLQDLLPSGIVDLIVMDMQGYEMSVLAPAIDFRCENVRHLFVGTHSRKIEGELWSCSTREVDS